MKYLLLSILIIVAFVQIAESRSKDEWKTRTIYQLLTDRFSKGDGSGGQCDLRNYCGGNYQGILRHLDYIKNMGFDAIWITPVIDNYDGGYHGYWARNMYDVNHNFGSADDLKQFVNACHAQDIWVMVDVVGNHMGNTNQDYSQNKPFNDRSHYHDYCVIQDSDFATHNIHNLQFCRLAGLADLNSESSFVQQEMSKWINWLIKEFQFDGIRIDTIIEVPTFFWKQFTQAAGVFSIGEAFDGDYSLVASFIGSVDSVLNYPQYFTSRDVFLHFKDMTDIKNFYNNWGNIVGRNNLQYLGNFNDNHDNPRFLSDSIQMSYGSFLQEKLTFSTEKFKMFKAHTAFALTSIGIPIIYYGTEQGFAGRQDPQNREVLWNNLDQNHEMYKFIQAINQARHATNAPSQPQEERFADQEVYAFSRGKLFAAFTNKHDRVVRKRITYHPYSEGQRLCNIFYPSQDCFHITNGGFDLVLNYGEVKIFIPA